MWGDKNFQICVRLTETQFAKIEERSNRTGKSKSDVIRDMINGCLADCPPKSGQKNNEGSGVTASDTPVNQ